MNSYTIGVDEVGRGCVAGPVYLAGVAVDSTFPVYTNQFDPHGFTYNTQIAEYKLVRDSKKLSKGKREKISELIKKSDFPYLCLSASNQQIDKYGIGVCLSHLLVLLCTELSSKIYGEYTILVDGQIKLIENLEMELTQALLSAHGLFTGWSLAALDEEWRKIKPAIRRENKADDKYLSVSLASNLAKVHRDSVMTSLSTLYPQYGWDQNKGYGTKSHLKAISQNPNNDYLRYSFLTKQNLDLNT